MYSVRELTVGKSYKVTVRAVNIIGESLTSSELDLHAGTVPQKIQYLVWEASTTTSITVRYQKPASNGGLSLLSYNLYVDAAQSGTFVPQPISDVY